MGVIRRALSRLRNAFQPAHFRRVTRVASVADIPDALDPRTIVLVGPASEPKWAVFACPCVLGHVVQLNLQPHAFPHWGATTVGSEITIRPSVDVRGA